MSNQHESLRANVTELVNKLCVKTSQSGDATVFNWSIARVFSECEKAFSEYCGGDKRLPEGLKNIVRFEFNKLKESVMSSTDWQALKSRESYAYSNGSFEKRRNDTFGLKAITLTEQLKGGLILLDKCGKAIANSKNQEATERLVRRQRNLLKEIAFIRGEIETQEKLKVTTTVSETVAN